MAETAEKFNTAMAGWQEWQDAPWGRLRYVIAEANLARHLADLPAGPLRILDVAGGNGADAVRLAARGHHVTIVDHAHAMLDAAGERAQAEGLADRITCVQAGVDRLPAEVTSTQFDVVLCHNLIQYTDDARQTLAAALAPLRPGGLLSVISANRHSASLTAAIREMDLAAALAALDTDRGRTRMFDAQLRLRTAEEIQPMLEELGCRDVHHYGIRSVCDYITDDARKHDPKFYADLERLELAVTARHPHKHTARFFQLIARTCRTATACRAVRRGGS
ncbi:methyltransferase domain-containing protein [Streptomyces sp. AF1A]|uniref:methyltransferase domain-containing protein n=1 Tax=Streptomyces sp. AF1A TaxID=3394350 RepID=UPI0039BC9CF0